MFRLNKNSVKKFNKLLDEVAAYYNLTAADITNGEDDDIIHIIRINSLGLEKKAMTSSEVLFKSVGENYPYLVPFVKVFKAQIFERTYREHISPRTLEEINWIIKKIREEKSATENRS